MALPGAGPQPSVEEASPPHSDGDRQLSVQAVVRQMGLIECSGKAMCGKTASSPSTRPE